MTEAELMQKLIAFIGKKSITQAAKKLGISYPYLYDVLKGNRSVSSPAILKKFKLKKVVALERR